ncbi:MAG: hypothetical protein WKF40_04535 [Thermoleophilaceae bacterium]
MVIGTTAIKQEAAAELRPPRPPWRALRTPTGPHGYISVYLSDAIARYPIRAVTKARDNKSDPNIETGTYGVFSTCQVKMRKSIVTKGVPYVFFVTTHGSKSRALAGYYRVAWYAPGPEQDFALAARTWRFVEPIPATSLQSPLLQAVELRRGYMGLDEAQATQLREVVDGRPDLTARYVMEVERLEALSARHTGYRYPTWRRERGWSWADAATYLAEPAVPSSGPVANRAPGGVWVCSVCTERSTSEARLKCCPECGALAALRPLTQEA